MPATGPDFISLQVRDLESSAASTSSPSVWSAPPQARRTLLSLTPSRSHSPSAIPCPESI